jgi:hypothetical protein
MTSENYIVFYSYLPNTEMKHKRFRDLDQAKHFFKSLENQKCHYIELFEVFKLKKKGVSAS